MSMAQVQFFRERTFAAVTLDFDGGSDPALVEGAGPFASRVRAQLAKAARKCPTLGAAVSRMSWLDCRLRPARNNELATLSVLDAFFARRDLVWVKMTQNVVELATAIRVRRGLRNQDALQAASCLQLGDAPSGSAPSVS